MAREIENVGSRLGPSGQTQIDGRFTSAQFSRFGSDRSK